MNDAATNQDRKHKSRSRHRVGEAMMSAVLKMLHLRGLKCISTEETIMQLDTLDRAKNTDLKSSTYRW